MRRRWLVATGLVVAALPATSVDAIQDRSPAAVEISAMATQFLPQVTEVRRGTGVVWTNRETTNYPVVIGNHNIIPDEQVGVLPGHQPFPTSSVLLTPGDRWSCTGSDSGLTCVGIDGKPIVLGPGRYAYLCGIHSNQMHGLLIVSGEE